MCSYKIQLLLIVWTRFCKISFERLSYHFAFIFLLYYWYCYLTIKKKIRGFTIEINITLNTTPIVNPKKYDKRPDNK